MAIEQDIKAIGLRPNQVVYNPSVPELYEYAFALENARIASSGALVTYSGLRTGRSPSDRRIVENPESQHEIWWGDTNLPLRPTSFRSNRQRAIDYLNSRDTLFVVDGFAGWDSRYQIQVRLISDRPYHALFLRNMLIDPCEADHVSIDQPDLLILNAGSFPADPLTPDVTSRVSINLNLESKELVILGTEFAGEMKKGVFSLMNYLLPQQDVLSLHCAANEGVDGDVTLFLGLSGTGKTSLANDPNRKLIGDDEHGWSDQGIFNVEGGCYAKCANLSKLKEPGIYESIRFGTVLENIAMDPQTRIVDFDELTITENTRASYPIDFVSNVKRPATASHPSNIILLTYDAFGVLPAVSRLSHEQAGYHFLNGYTAKVAGTEMDVSEPIATFSACYGAAFLLLPPSRYAGLFADRLAQHDPEVWLVNTGWSGGNHQTGERIDLQVTRSIIDSIHDGSLAQQDTATEPYFGLAVPKSCPTNSNLKLMPGENWDDPEQYGQMARMLKSKFQRNVEKLNHETFQLTSHTAEFHRPAY